MGLDISHGIVAQHHRGQIEVTSRPGETVFTVRLPLDFEHEGTTVGETWRRPEDDALREILRQTRTIAVVGSSTRPGRPSYTVPAYLQSQGYDVRPVNPSCEKILGVVAYPDLAAVPEPIDVVLVFRRAEEVPAVAQVAIAKHARVLWLQEGIVSVPAARVARAAGLTVVMDTCMSATHKRLLPGAAE
jgi:predicted CoA-binding protein